MRFIKIIYVVLMAVIGIGALVVFFGLAAQGAESLTSTPDELARYTRTEMQRWQRHSVQHTEVSS